MKRNILVILIAASFMCQGCVPLMLVGGGVYAVKKVKKRKPKLSDMQRREIETKEIEGSREDVFRAMITVFQNRGYSLQNSDYDAGFINAGSEKPYLQVTGVVEEFTETRIKIRITMKDEDCVMEDGAVFLELFDDIQTEVFRRVNIKN